MDFQDKNAGIRFHFLLQGIFPTQGSNMHLLHWQAVSLLLSHLGTPRLGTVEVKTSSDQAYSLFCLSFLFSWKGKKRKKNSYLFFLFHGNIILLPFWFPVSFCGYVASQVALVVKNPLANAGDSGDTSLIPGSGRSAGERNGNPLQHSCQENPMDRGAWWATVHGVTKSWTQLGMCVCTHTHTHIHTHIHIHTCSFADISWMSRSLGTLPLSSSLPSPCLYILTLGNLTRSRDPRSAPPSLNTLRPEPRNSHPSALSHQHHQDWFLFLTSSSPFLPTLTFQVQSLGRIPTSPLPAGLVLRKPGPVSGLHEYSTPCQQAGCQHPEPCHCHALPARGVGDCAPTSQGLPCSSAHLQARKQRPSPNTHTYKAAK